MQELIVIGSFQNEAEATIARGQLQAAGIDTQLRLSRIGDAMLGAAGLQNGPMDLMVDAKDAEKAKQILQERS